ncbi:protein phosphatase 1 regulatory subunit 12A-like isoform X3 [Mercenaria mercenaria]|uniref:protein phosphatase 1 regulatory subunit 12A-like isoform X3 n=1 Tax=Mercenaria mercenaria TaxID=6596 RepID=UPI00234F1662|nr:protein phosphatase 1 regulatory subunit 12A-like isoform X3 [Mercenaria mercenaria]
MADEKQQTSAIFKRHEQLKRWEDSDTNKCLNHTLGKEKKVKFQDGCVFLAACSSGDSDEVKRLLDRGADINTANIDGLTALHQACIDDNLDMVEFLVEHGADVDVCDNEGWTPLHATASCGFTEIARYLLRQGANVAAVNNDGDLPFDICEDDTMEKLLQECMDEQGVDADAARREEEDSMMEDANQWLNSVQKGESIEEFKHPKTGATALHVASAKGYVKVMTILLQAGFDLNAKDTDGWTALHAAAHWGQEESCKILAENMCDMEAKNLAGQTAFDVADTELVKLLEELKLKQASLKDQQKDLQIIQTRLPASRRSRNDPARSSVTRMSVEQKHNVMKNVDGQERATLDVIPPATEEEKAKSSSSSCSEEEESESSTESETEKKNEINKKTSQQNQPRDRDKPPIMTTVEIKEKQTPEMPKIEESVETTEKENIKFMDDENEELKNELKKEAEVIGDGLKKDKIFNNDKKDIQKEEKEKEILKPEKTDDTLKNKEIVNNNKEEKKELDLNEEKKKDMDKDVDKVKVIEKVKETDIDKDTPLIENVAPKKDRAGLKRTASAPPSITEVPKISINTKLLKDDNKGENEIPSWRLGLRKTGSTSMVPHDSSVNKPVEEDKNLPRSASSPRIGEEDENKKNEKNDKPVTRRPYLSSSSFSTADHNNSSVSERSQGLTNPYRYSAGSGLNSTTSYQSSYVPYYRRQQLENERKEREKSDKETGNKENVANNRISAPTSLPVTSSTVTTASTISTTSSSTTITTPTSSFTHYRKSYEPPKRDEETEMLRKVRAKRARETRRSTQGVTLEEVQQANEVLRKSEPIDPSATSSSAATTTSAADRSKSSSDDRKSQDTTDSVNKDAISSDRDVSSRLSADVTSNLRRTNSALDSDSSSLSSWRRSRDIEGNKKDDDTATRSSSFRRSRADRDLTSSAPSSSFYSTDSTYVPRNRSDRTERNALSVADIGNTSLGGSVNLTRSTSLRTDRLRSAEDDSSRIELRRDREKEKEKETNKEDKGDKDDKRPESAAIRSRRMRRERRSTGIANYTPEVIKRIRESAQQWAGEKENNKDDEDEKDKENKDDSKDEIKTDTDDKTIDQNIERWRYLAGMSSRYNRYGSTSDVPGHLTTARPSSYSEYSRSSTALDKDYKKLYEDEKHEKERLKRELEQCKKELREAKLELDRQMKKNEANRVSDTNDKRERRALERKLSELEEEIKKMDQLKEDNRRLREENGALIRVISKLSK